MFRRILVATDFADSADSALRVAQARAGYSGADVAGCHVCDEKDDCVERRDELERRVQAVAGDDTLPLEMFVETGDLADAVSRRASEWHADLLVVGSASRNEGRLSRWFHTDTVSSIVRHAPCTVLVTRNTPATCRVVVGCDLSEASMPVLRAAAAEQARTGGSVTVVNCIFPSWGVVAGDTMASIPVDQDELAGAARSRMQEMAEAAGLTAQLEVLFADPSEGITRLATDLAADVVVVGTHGRTGVRRVFLGSVAESVVHKAPCAVMVVRHTDAAAAAHHAA